MSDAGNFEHGATVLYLAQESADESALARETCGALLALRRKRVPPGTDRKILAGWNGLAIAGLCWAGRALLASGEAAQGDPELGREALRAADVAFDCVCQRMSAPGDRLYSTLQQGKPRFNAYLDDYAFLAQAAIELARAPGTVDPAARLLQARRWVDVILARFAGTPGAGYFFTATTMRR